MNKKILLFLVFIGFFIAGIAISRFVLVDHVTLIHPRTGEVVEAVYATGSVEPTISVPIAPRTTSHLTELTVQEGQSIKKGDILARLEDNEQQAAIQDLKAREVFAEMTFARQQQLYKSHSISKDVLDSAKADVDSLQAQVDKAKAQAAYLTLVAPADGVIIKRDGEVGELITAGTPIYYLSCCAPLRITAEVDEEDIPRVKIDQPVLIQSDAFPDKIFHGKVSSVTPMGDSVARSYRVRISFDDPAVPLMIGMTAETNIVIRKESNAILIPVKALGKNKTVQIVRDQILHITKVETGIEDGNHIQITSGVTSGDAIVTPYQEDLKDGQKVQTRLEPESAE